MKLKNLILIFLGILLVHTSEASPSTQNLVLLEKQISVAFAPPEYQGIFKFQLLVSGEVQKVDNKNVVTKLAVLAPSIVREIQVSVNSLPDDLKLTLGTGPRCADAPVIHTTVRKNSAKFIVIRSRLDCIPGDSTNNTALNLANWADTLERTLTTHFMKDDEGRSGIIGQEGYGSEGKIANPKVLACEEEIPVADDGFSLYLERILGSSNMYNMVIERSLLIENVTERFVVEDKTDPLIDGAPVRYENATVKLNIQATVTPRPDGRLPGTFVMFKTIHHSDGSQHKITEERNLLCNYVNRFH